MVGGVGDGRVEKHNRIKICIAFTITQENIYKSPATVWDPAPEEIMGPHNEDVATRKICVSTEYKLQKMIHSSS